MFTYYSTVKKTEADARNERRQMYVDVPHDPILFLGRSVETRRGGQPTTTSNKVVGEDKVTRPFFHVPPSTDHFMDRSIQYMQPPLAKPRPFPPPRTNNYTFLVETRTKGQINKGPAVL
jgi:hypothetical protein